MYYGIPLKELDAYPLLFEIIALENTKLKIFNILNLTFPYLVANF